MGGSSELNEDVIENLGEDIETKCNIENWTRMALKTLNSYNRLDLVQELISCPHQFNSDYQKGLNLTFLTLLNKPNHKISKMS